MSSCPRRMRELGPWEYKDDLDHWRTDQTCSFCGSLHPDEFMKEVEAGTQLSPTDKRYKVYVAGMRWKFYFQHLSDEQMTRFIELLNAKKINIGYPGYFYTLPFFISYSGDGD